MQISKSLLCVAGLGALVIFARFGMTQDTKFDSLPVDSDGFQPEPRNVDPPTNRADFERDDAYDDAHGSNQFGAFGERAARQPQIAAPMRERVITRTVREMTLEPIPAEEIAAAKKLQDAITRLNSSEDDDAREKAKDLIQEQLKIQFEHDLKKREAELAEVEKRVKTLREQFDKRKAAQDDIIKLRLQTLVNEASGLGFPASFATRPTIPPIAPARSPFPTDSLRQSVPFSERDRVPDFGEPDFDRGESLPGSLKPEDDLR